MKNPLLRPWRALQQQPAPAQLIGLVAASAVAALVLAKLPGGWYPPEYWFVALAVFFAVWLTALVVLHGVRHAWTRSFPPEVLRTGRGGSSASVEIRPSVDLECYGRGRLVGEHRGREQSFALAWEDTREPARAIRGGDAAVLMLATVDATDPKRPSLCISGTDGAVQSTDLAPFMDQTGHLTDGVPWVALRIELRAKARPETWISDYRIRLSRDWRFEIQDLTR